MDRLPLIAFLEAFAVGDALGMPTEFMRREQIKERFGLVDRILEPGISWTHPDLPFASVTDDTEQLWRLTQAYDEKGVSVGATVEALLAWIRETDAVAKRYIGPSSLKALKAIEAGADPTTTGTTGTTCGGIMRSPAAVLATLGAGSNQERLARQAGLASKAGDPLVEAVHACCLPTHNTQVALEAAMAYAFALREAFETGATGVALGGAVMDAALAGAAQGAGLAPAGFPGPSVRARLAYLRKVAPGWTSTDEVLDFLSGVLGSGIESVDVCACVFGIFLYAGSDVMLALSMGASLGGDTDTIAALAGGLCAACAKGHSIPGALVRTVLAANRLDPGALADIIGAR